ncbi:hypothetical protein AX15_002520 [Amanita polypyramis BW_CC]|nr:hypothetical protein AX15_002520 [Amanita polypyramis BW_CC]
MREECVSITLPGHAIHGFDQVVSTANKMLKIAKILSCEVVCTTQDANALGPIDPAVDLSSLGPLLIGNYDKTSFSMLTPSVKSVLQSRPRVKSIVIFGIESHICVLQSVLSLVSLPHPYSVYVIADGVSSCNRFEVPVSIAQMQKEGAIITTSESLGFQLVKDSAIPEFKDFSRLIREEKESTRRAGELLLCGTTTQSSGEQGKLESERKKGSSLHKSVM